MFRSSLYGESVLRPLFFDYPADNETYKDTEHTFMLGHAIKASPVFTNSLGTYSVYFPKGQWADLTKHYGVLVSDDGAYFDLEPSYTYLNVHQKEGTIIPYQENTGGYKTTTDFQTKMKTTLIVFRGSKDNDCVGHMLIDDGISSDSYSANKYNLLEIKYFHNN
jgi:lysosomal alpha-glucosidase